MKFMNLNFSQSSYYYKRRRRTEGSILSSSNIIYTYNIIWEVLTRRRFDDEGLPVAGAYTEYFIPHNSYTTVLVRRSKKIIINK